MTKKDITPEQRLEQHLKWQPANDEAAFRLVSALKARDPDIRARLSRSTDLHIGGRFYTVPEYVHNITLKSWRFPDREAGVYVERGGARFEISTTEHERRDAYGLDRAVAFLLTYFSSSDDAFDGTPGMGGCTPC